MKKYGSKTNQCVICGACIEPGQTVRKIRKQRDGRRVGVWNPDIAAENSAELASHCVPVVEIMESGTWLAQLSPAGTV
jgi:hypothetical protein